ncbi:MAG TPA: metal-dependent hydrolase [Rhizomicrobium sp.]|nr:metal-dependent hydrolase [Rhizomicrobium sp.]
MTATTKTPDDLVIRPRDRNFRCGRANERWWAGNDPVATAYYNAFSASFPQVERYFIEALRRYRDRAGPKLQQEIAAFIAQEAVHSREHITFNRDTICSGYDLSRIDALLKKRLAWARTLSPVRQAASVAALEHYTAILSHEVIDKTQLDAAPAEIRRLMYWHAGEEVEHKAVAFDTFMLAAQHLSPPVRWLLRSSVMICSTFLLFQFFLFSVAEFFRQDGIRSARTWTRFLKFVLITPGALGHTIGVYFSWYLPGFHPWRLDDRALIAKAEWASAPPQTADLPA